MVGILDQLRNRRSLDSVALDCDYRRLVVDIAAKKKLDVAEVELLLDTIGQSVEGLADDVAAYTTRARLSGQLEGYSKAKNASDAAQSEIEALTAEREKLLAPIDAKIADAELKLKQAQSGLTRAAKARGELLRTAPEFVSEELEQIDRRAGQLKRHLRHRALPEAEDNQLVRFEDGDWQAVDPRNAAHREALERLRDRQAELDEIHAAMRQELSDLEKRRDAITDIAFLPMPLPEDMP